LGAGWQRERQSSIKYWGTLCGRLRCIWKKGGKDGEWGQRTVRREKGGSPSRGPIIVKRLSMSSRAWLRTDGHAGERKKKKAVEGQRLGLV